MRNLNRALAAIVLAGWAAPTAWAVEAPARTETNQTIWSVRNLSGATLDHGDAVVFQTFNNDAEIEVGAAPGQFTTLGLDVTTTTTADNQQFVGCISPGDTCLDNELCRVVVIGPAMCNWAGSTDNTNTRGATVGTTTVAGALGSGTNAGVLMSLSLDSAGAESNGVHDTEVRWIMLQGPGGGN